jgi:hypothetical protein
MLYSTALPGAGGRPASLTASLDFSRLTQSIVNVFRYLAAAAAQDLFSDSLGYNNATLDLQTRNELS